MLRLCTRFSPVLSPVLAGLCQLSVVLPLLAVSNARAYDDQASVDLAVGYVHMAPSGPLPQPGTELTLGAGYGLGDMFVLRGSLGYGLQVDSARRASVGRGRVEVAYLLDVLSVVPFFGGGASAWLFKDESVTIAPGGHLLVGMDLLLTREWNAGLDVRIGMLAESRDVFSTTEAQLRLTRMFDLL